MVNILNWIENINLSIPVFDWDWERIWHYYNKSKIWKLDFFIEKWPLYRSSICFSKKIKKVIDSLNLKIIDKITETEVKKYKWEDKLVINKKEEYKKMWIDLDFLLKCIWKNEILKML